MWCLGLGSALYNVSAETVIFKCYTRLRVPPYLNENKSHYRPMGMGSHTLACDPDPITRCRHPIRFLDLR